MKQSWQYFISFPIEQWAVLFSLFEGSLVVNSLIIHLTIVDITVSEFGWDVVIMGAIASTVSEESPNPA